MKRFATHMALFLAVQGALLGGMFWFQPTVGGGEQEYLARAIDKRVWLRQAPSPRIIFVGGSNLPFGLDSDSIRRQTGYTPVNMGLAASLSINLMLGQVAPELRAGDVVVLSLEYRHFTGAGPDETLVRLLLCDDPQAVRYLSWDDDKWLLDDGLLQYVRSLGRSRLQAILGRGGKPPGMKPPYLRSAFNLYGDMVMHRTMTSRLRRHPERLFYDPQRVRDLMEKLNAFAAGARRRGATVLLSYPPLVDDVYRDVAHKVRRIDQEVRTLAEFPVLDRPEDLALHENLFFDTQYHLNAKGLAWRTQHVIEQLRGRVPFHVPLAAQPETRTVKPPSP